LHLTFEELAFDNQFDGIWASASLLHVPRSHLPDVLARLKNALKPGGILYATFVYGSAEVLRGGGLLFNDQNEQSFQQLLAGQPGFALLKLWQAADLPPVRDDRRWLHVIVKKALSS
jgi:SAM-dependent methyltransferase